MVGNRMMNGLLEILGGLSPVGKIQKTICPVMEDRTGIGMMRDQLLTEFREPFINRVAMTSNDVLIKDVKIRTFDERVNTLPDEYIAELYENARKFRTLECGEKKEEVRNYILESLELSFYLDGWCVDWMIRGR